MAGNDRDDDALAVVEVFASFGIGGCEVVDAVVVDVIICDDVLEDSGCVVVDPVVVEVVV